MALAFSVDSASLVVSSYTHVLSGAKSSDIVSMTLNGASGRITFPSSTTWKAELVLGAGDNLFSIQGQDGAGKLTPVKKITLTLPACESAAHTFFNSLDEHALIVGLRRNPGEKNWEFRLRLIAFAAARTGASIETLHRAAAYEMGLKPVPEALGIKVRRDSNGRTIGTEVYVEITPVYVYVDAVGLTQTREAHRVEPRTRSITLNQTPRWTDEVRVFNAQDDLVSTHRFKVDAFERTITFGDDELNGDWVTVHYPYRYRIDHRGLTMIQLEALLEAVTVGGQQMLDVTVADGTLPTLGLSRQGRTLMLPSEYRYIEHAMCQVTPLDNREWQESLYNTFGAAYGTKLEQYARKAAERSNLGWDNLVLDEGFWDVETENEVLDYLPRLWDPVFGRWRCSQASCTNYYNFDEYRKYNGYCPDHPTQQLVYVGVKQQDIKSGICEEGSLYATMVAVDEEL